MKLGCHVGPFFSALPVSEPHYVIRENKLRNTRCNKFVAHPPDSDDQFRALGIQAALAYATGGAATTVPQAIAYVARSRSAEATAVPPRPNFAALPPPANA